MISIQHIFMFIFMYISQDLKVSEIIIKPNFRFMKFRKYYTKVLMNEIGQHCTYYNRL